MTLSHLDIETGERHSRRQKPTATRYSITARAPTGAVCIRQATRRSSGADSRPDRLGRNPSPPQYPSCQSVSSSMWPLPTNHPAKGRLSDEIPRWDMHCGVSCPTATNRDRLYPLPYATDWRSQIVDAVFYNAVPGHWMQ